MDGWMDGWMEFRIESLGFARDVGGGAPVAIDGAVQQKGRVQRLMD